MLNKVILIGRLTKEPELKYTNSNKPVLNNTIAVNRAFTDANGERTADFINFVVWNKQAENIKKYLKKGSLIAIEGRIETRNYENNDGNRVYVTEVIASNVTFLESKGASAAPTSNNEPSPYDFEEPKETKKTKIEEDPFADFGDAIEISDDDLPF
jgi:single-strand DNA-binding protein